MALAQIRNGFITSFSIAESNAQAVVVFFTNGGLVGRVTKVAENGYIAIALNDTTEVVIKRDFVAAVLPKGTMKAL